MVLKLCHPYYTKQFLSTNLNTILAEHLAYSRVLSQYLWQLHSFFFFVFHTHSSLSSMASMHRNFVYIRKKQPFLKPPDCHLQEKS